MSTTQASPVTWSQDVLLPAFEATGLSFADDYDGPVAATLVRRNASASTSSAFLYLHGYIDYFFQAHLAEQCNAHGYNFYALDMRKYGRSLGAAKHPNFCKDISEYYPEITEAIRIITEDDTNTFVVLNGHSTGGLVAALYAAEGASRGKVNALILNSPFFEFNVSPAVKAFSGIIAQFGRVAPFSTMKNSLSDLYPKSLHKDYRGEWDFDLRLKPLQGFPTYLGWVNAVHVAHNRVRQGLNIACSVLVMQSDRSVYGKEWSEAFRHGDAVLNVSDIREGSRRLGSNVNDVEIEGGLHDLVLSKPVVRERVFSEMFTWLETTRQSG